MDNANKYSWTFRQTVGKMYVGKPRYALYTFESLLSLFRAIIYFQIQFLKRLYRNGWKGRWWA